MIGVHAYGREECFFIICHVSVLILIQSYLCIILDRLQSPRSIRERQRRVLDRLLRMVSSLSKSVEERYLILDELLATKQDIEEVAPLCLEVESAERAFKEAQAQAQRKLGEFETMEKRLETETLKLRSAQQERAKLANSLQDGSGSRDGSDAIELERKKLMDFEKEWMERTDREVDDLERRARVLELEEKTLLDRIEWIKTENAKHQKMEENGENDGEMDGDGDGGSDWMKEASQIIRDRISKDKS
jgi:hypothetical protein